MVVGVLTVDLYFPESRSIKEKRQYLRSIKERIKNSFNVSVAEVDGQDLWQRSLLAVVCVGAERSIAEEILAKVRNFVDKSYPEFILSTRVEFINL
ncbi:DUF503 domain-containing protein [Thermocrinis minervae]|uniref:DUF503 domain-containing protein n=1 Tax=Thermocrinis minervae TaxID=381751 RepID=A0A1M6S1Y9_9AQUI|nr:DUF503 domain-containing protein [Thermocrinis minervae]SHK38715.1 hypothetical protein SAMN05444391_0847 [Thermocrinis minervae]